MADEKWQPMSEDEMDAATDFENNPALRSEVEADAKANLDLQPQKYFVGDDVLTVQPKTVEGLLNAQAD